MDDKRKPYATVSIRRPRLSQVTAAVLASLLFASAAAFVLREIEGWRSSLRDSQDQLQAAQEQFATTEAELRVIRNALRHSPLSYQTLRPVGFAVPSYGMGAYQSDAEATFCLRMPDGLEPYFVAQTNDLSYVGALIESGDYELAGKDELSAGWIQGRYMNDDYYTRKDVLERLPYQWSRSETWSSNSARWETRLRQFCTLTITD
ncbi:MAG: hypothetical protein F4X02_11535 [Chloroflexi bacterium]|nr:hypothetical protein [Chloroflexota bacterium]